MPVEKTCPECGGSGTVLKRDRSESARHSRGKGNSAELRVAKLIAAALGVPYSECRRTPNSGALIERADLRFSERVLRLFPYFVEVKNREGWDFWQAFSAEPGKWEPHAWYVEAELKARRDARTGFSDGKVRPVLLVLLQNRRLPLAMLRGDSDEMVVWVAEDEETVRHHHSLVLRVHGYTVFRFDEFLAGLAKALKEVGSV